MVLSLNFNGTVMNFNIQCTVTNSNLWTSTHPVLVEFDGPRLGLRLGLSLLPAAAVVSGGRRFLVVVQVGEVVVGRDGGGEDGRREGRRDGRGGGRHREGRHQRAGGAVVGDGGRGLARLQRGEAVEGEIYSGLRIAF